MDGIKDAYYAAPPVIRTITLFTVVTSVLVYTNLLEAYKIVFYPPLIFTVKRIPQIWRIATSFWLTGPKLGMIFDPYFLYMYGSGLETDSPRFSKPGDFMAYIVFVETVILILCGGGLGGVVFLQPLILAIAYTFSQDNAERRSSFFILTIQTKYLPYCMLALTFVMAGPTTAYHQVTGLIAAHAYDFLTSIWPTFGGGRNWIDWATPNALRRLFGDRPGERTATARGFGTAYRGGAQAQQGPSQGQSTGWSNPLSSGGSSWGQRGAGRRLGD